MAPRFSNGTKQIIMDTKIIRQYGEEILSYRIRTARQKKRMQHKDFERHLIQLDKEQRALYRQKKSLGWVQLTPHVQKGWKRFFVLREDVARGPHAAFFQEILDKINTKDWSHRKDFLVRKRRQGKKKYVVKSQKLLETSAKDFLKFELSEAQKFFFHEEWKLDGSKHLRRHFVFSEPWRFVLRTRPNIITKVRVRDEVMEARMKAIDNYLERNGLEWKQVRLLYGNCKWRHRDWKKCDEAYSFETWPLERILDKLKEE
jgi:hypothetical protein